MGFKVWCCLFAYVMLSIILLNNYTIPSPVFADILYEGTFNFLVSYYI